eukprot:CAMPEP_0177759810 /NCGR_PEP_ID=MMETSP0491_2-20121128/4928_1 /TAXON_ID=63592 /ORGANISM="Tetraselmis chuii, Strain PLY429" /LENGTH=77 /DNA_ID=CAMNT_0019275659 /DNA_START=360 /DNA_END=593 /DNA_ORIENTATION=-
MTGTLPSSHAGPKISALKGLSSVGDIFLNWRNFNRHAWTEDATLRKQTRPPPTSSSSRVFDAGASHLTGLLSSVVRK